MVTSSFRLLGIVAALSGCSSARGGGGDDDDGAGAGNTAFIAPYSACSGTDVDELWEPVFDALQGALPAEASSILSCIATADDCTAVLSCAGYDTSQSHGDDHSFSPCRRIRRYK